MPEDVMWGMPAPAGNLESGAENLGAYEFRHDDCWCYDAATGAKNGLGRKLGVVVVEEGE